MADENTQTIDNTPAIETMPEGGGLPSANTDIDTSGFEINDEIKSKFKDGKLNGRFGNLTEVLDHLKAAEDFKANTIREQKTNEEQTIAQKTSEQKALDTQQKQQTVIMEMLPEFTKNGMTLTPEMEATAVEAGIDIRDLKLGALELKEKTLNAHAVVGSSEEYGEMIAWGKETMTEAQRKAFDIDVANSEISEYAIKGLYSDYTKAKADGGETFRINGDAHVTHGIKPYTSQRELFADKNYIESSKGRRDTAAIKQYRARFKITPDNVAFGRK